MEVSRFFFGLLAGAGLIICLALGKTAPAQQPFPVYQLPWQPVDTTRSFSPFSPVDSVFYPVWQPVAKRAADNRQAVPFSPPQQDFVFYMLFVLLLFLGGLIKIFPKYFQDLYRVVAKAGFRQKSIRDQLAQNSMASMLLNLVFFMSGGTFLFLVAMQQQWVPGGQWISYLLLSIAFVALLYGVKYVGLLLARWLFGYKEAMDTYIFVVFYFNKVLGLLLLPAVVLLWLGNPVVHGPVLTLALLLIGVVFTFRYRLVLPLVRSLTGISVGHFLLYLFGFEVLPILLLSKILLNYVN
jgi:hypothetical protein